MKTLHAILCLMLTAALLSGAALAETYTDDWGNGVTLNFEIDDSLRQPLDIFDAAYSLDLEPTDNNLNQAKALMQKGMELTFKGAIPAVQQTTYSTGFPYLSAVNEDDQYGERFSRSRFSTNYFDIYRNYQYMSMEIDLDDCLSTLHGKQNEFSYPAKRED